MNDQTPQKAFPSIQGRCPACRGDSLFVGSGGYVTCARIGCPNPSAADEVLHSEQVSAHTPLVCSDERHAAKVTALEAEREKLRDLLRAEKQRADKAIERETALEEEVEALSAGEEPVTDPHAEHTPGQWIWQWNRATPVKRLEVAAAVMRDAARASQCFLMNHEKRFDDDRHAWVAVARVRDVIADMEGITGARHWARILRTAVEGEQPAPAPAATEATEPTTCAAYQPPTTAEDSGLCAGCGMYDYKHHATATEATEPATVTDPQYLRQQIHAAIEDEIYEYRERTMFWPEGGVTKEIARLATRGAMSVRDRHLAQLRQRLELAAEWTPPPPGSTREQLPDDLLDLIRDRLPDYLSTACQTADTVACTACYPRSGVPRPQYDEIREHADRLHERCRLNHKFTGQLCACGCHPTKEQP